MCEQIKLPDGNTVMICGGRSRRQFCACGREAVFLCDWKVSGRKSGTCDKPICGHHAQTVGAGKHLCQEHQKTYEAWQQRHPASVPLQPSQPSLFEGKS